MIDDKIYVMYLIDKNLLEDENSEDENSEDEKKEEIPSYDEDYLSPKINKKSLKFNIDVKGSPVLSKKFMEALPQIFSPQALRKINRLNQTLVVDKYSNFGDIMAKTSHTKVTISSYCMSQPPDVAVKYLVHEFFHVLENLPSYQEYRRINDSIFNSISEKLEYGKITPFISGKNDLHSDPKKECLSYLAGNGSYQWKMLPDGKLKGAIKQIISKSGQFNSDSQWWKSRFETKKF